MKAAANTPGLSGNQLKIIALIAMTVDHAGVTLFPGVPLLRIIGRLAFPIFAYMIAEGCQYTHDRRKYLLAMSGLAATCHTVYFLAMGSLYMSVLVSFSLAICLIYAVDFAKGKGGTAWLAPLAGLTLVFFLCEMLPHMLPHTDYGIDYGLWGCLLPLFVYLGKTKWERLWLAAIPLCMLGAQYGTLQWFGLLALLPLAMYNGTRGKRKLKYLFYIYYPLHLVVIQGLSWIL